MDKIQSLRRLFVHLQHMDKILARHHKPHFPMRVRVRTYQPAHKATNTLLVCKHTRFVD